MKKVRLTVEEQRILASSPVDLLLLLTDVAHHKSFPEFIKLINKLIDYEKNVFFTAKEYDDKKLAVDHAFARGGIAKLATLVHLIGASEHELSKRKETHDA